MYTMSANTINHQTLSKITSGLCNCSKHRSKKPRGRLRRGLEDAFGGRPGGGGGGGLLTEAGPAAPHPAGPAAGAGPARRPR